MEICTELKQMLHTQRNIRSKHYSVAYEYIGL